MEQGAKVWPVVDLQALAAELEVDLGPAFVRLAALYAFVDERNSANTANLDLPCSRGCDACCHESVFLTPLEFFFVWDFVQKELSAVARSSMVERGLALYREHEHSIGLLDEPPADGAPDHLKIAQELRFRCPLLRADGVCGVYSARELYARLFGSCFNDEGGIYGCELVGAHLGGKQVSLLRARGMAERLNELPLTFKRQVFPWYIHLLYSG